MDSAAPPPSWDERIQRRLARGEETALAELYDRTAPLVHGLAGRILADQDAAEQLTREVFAHLWEHPEAFDPDRGSLRAWLGALTRRRALDRLRLEQGPAGPPPRERSPEVADSLPDDLREAVALAWLEGHDYRETARRLGIDEATAKERLRRALRLVSGGPETAGDPAAGGAPAASGDPAASGAPGGAGNCANREAAHLRPTHRQPGAPAAVPPRAVPRAPGDAAPCAPGGQP